MDVYIETDKEIGLQSQLLYPHYTDRRFREGRTVFLAPGFRTVRKYGTDIVNNVSYAYSDRLREWYDKKYKEAWNEAEAKGFAKRSPAMLEAFLQELFGDPDLQLIHIVAGFDGNGYPYHVYGYISSNGE